MDFNKLYYQYQIPRFDPFEQDLTPSNLLIKLNAVRLVHVKSTVSVHGVRSTYFNLILKKINALKFKMYG